MRRALRVDRRWRRWTPAVLAAFTAVVAGGTGGDGPRQKRPLPTPREMAAALEDVWGEAALRLPDGPSYEFFKDLLPPLRYVNTAFRHYPIVLGTPGGRVKPRFVSNGSAVNARADKKPMWREVGFPVHFLVGAGAEPFGADLDRLAGPRYARGYLPVVQLAYRQDGVTYEQEAFAPVRDPAAKAGAVLLRFAVRAGEGQVTARLGTEGPVTANGGAVRDAKGEAAVLYDGGWRWDAARRALTARLSPDRPAVLAVLTNPLPPPVPLFTRAVYDAERQACVRCWEEVLARGMKLEVPEPIVNDAWRSLVIGNFLIAVGDRMHYSAGNAYDHLYEAECGDATRALMLYGYTADARRMIGPLLDFYRKATRFHVAGHKLQLLTHYYWVARDAAYLREKEPVWRALVDFLVESRETANGLLPPDNYAGDVSQQVYSLNSNANCWRGLRDLAAALADIGEQDKAAPIAAEARAFRKAILAAVERSQRRDVRPPFIPNALFGAEQPYDRLTATRLGNYYDLIAPYILGSEVFGPGGERETWMIEYFRQHGGLAMGMMRTTPHQGEFAEEPGVNVLYGLRYQLALLRRDDRGHALVGFYGQLAQGMTRDTFIGGEGSRFLHGDRHGRSFYLPPNSASNAMFLTTLRYLLIQDWDLNDDGVPETLRLLYGAPGRWLKDGATVRVERAPTAFGAVSFQARSLLSKGEVLVTVDAPPRRPAKLLVRPPLPAGWGVVGADVAGTALTPGAEGAVDVAGRPGRFLVRFRVARKEL